MSEEKSEKNSIVNNAVYNANNNISVSSIYNRKNYEDVAKLNRYKNELFENNRFIKDSYTNQRLYQNKADAVAKYGDNFNKHLVQIDHIEPLKNIHEKYKYNRFLTDEDIQQIANIKENYQGINGHMNQSKGGLNQSEYVNKHPEFSDNKAQLLEKNCKDAEKAISKEVIKKEAQVVGKAFVFGAAMGGGMSAVQNIKSYKDGEIDGKKAALNIAKDAAKSGASAGAMTYAVKKGEELILKKTAGKVVAQGCEKFVASGGVAKAAICLVEAGKSTVKYIKGDITAGQYAEELTEKGVSLSASFAVGAQGAAIGAMIGTLILPGVGTAIGGLIGELAGNIAGYELGRKVFQTINDYRKFLNEYDPEELRRYRELYDNVAEYTRQLREAYEVKMQLLYEQEADNMHQMMLGIRDSLLENDTDKLNLYIDNMCDHFGVDVGFKTLDEFDEYMMTDTVEVW